MKKRILLTGASGSVGYETLKQLCQKKDIYDITIFDIDTKSARKKFRPFKNEVEIIYGSITDKNIVDKITKNKDVVIHLAAIIPPYADENLELAYQVNTIGTENLIKSLEKNSPNAFFLYSSSISVYGDRLSTPFISVNDPLTSSEGDEYAVTKIKSEELIKNSKLNWSIFRLGAIMGGHKLSKLMFHQPLETSMEIATTEDTARAFVNAIEKTNQLHKQIFNLGGGENCQISYRDFLIQSFAVFGLGKLNFKPKSFAEKNFHCGFYNDGDVLENILHFRKDSLDTYFEKEKQKISPFKKRLISILKTPIKAFLQRQSEPLNALKNGDAELIKRFYNI